jgi:hypothetical protein
MYCLKSRDRLFGQQRELMMATALFLVGGLALINPQLTRQPLRTRPQLRLSAKSGVDDGHDWDSALKTLNTNAARNASGDARTPTDSRIDPTHRLLLLLPSTHSPGHAAQAIARLYRVNQKRDVRVTYLTSGGLNSRYDNIQMMRANMATLFNDDYTNVLYAATID